MSNVIELENFLQEQTELLNTKVLLSAAERRIEELEVITPCDDEPTHDIIKPLDINLPELKNRYPHLGKLTKVIERASALATLRPDGGFILPAPLLLVGAPGIGKTDFCHHLSSGQLHIETIDGGTLTAGFEITGASPVWRGGKAGRVHGALKAGSANPFIILDEADKINENDTSPIYSALGGLLESTTAAQFRDEFTGEAVDASNINWILTANDINQIPEHIIDRCQVVQCNAPDALQRQIVIKSIYQTVSNKLYAHGITLSSEALATMADGAGSFRLIKRAITNAIAVCVMRQATEIQIDDITPFLQQTESIKIGF